MQPQREPQPEKTKNQQKTAINQPESHRETTKQEQIQTQDKRILSPKTGYDQHTSPFKLYSDHTQDIVNVLLSMKKLKFVKIKRRQSLLFSI